MEKYLRKHPNLKKSKYYLLEEKYLMSDCIVHHINLDSRDNRIENLWLTENTSAHRQIHATLLSLVDSLLELNLIYFQEDNYFIDEKILNARR